VIFLSTYSIFEAVWKKKKLKGTVPGGAKWRWTMINCNHDEYIAANTFETQARMTRVVQILLLHCFHATKDRHRLIYILTRRRPNQGHAVSSRAQRPCSSPCAQFHREIGDGYVFNNHSCTSLDNSESKGGLTYFQSSLYPFLEPAVRRNKKCHVLAESHIVTSWQCDILVHNSIFGSQKIAYLRPFWGHFDAQT
jgi:hypothetical protein